MAKMCSDCNLNIAGQHEWDCLNNPDRIEPFKYRVPPDGTDLDAEYNYVCLERDHLEAELAKYRWIPVNKMPESFMQPHPPQDCELIEKYYALKYEAKIPEILSAADIWFDEGSEVEYWMPIILLEENEDG